MSSLLFAVVIAASVSPFQGMADNDRRVGWFQASHLPSESTLKSTSAIVLHIAARHDARSLVRG